MSMVLWYICILLDCNWNADVQSLSVYYIAHRIGVFCLLLFLRGEIIVLLKYTYNTHKTGCFHKNSGITMAVYIFIITKSPCVYDTGQNKAAAFNIFNTFYIKYIQIIMSTWPYGIFFVVVVYFYVYLVHNYICIHGKTNIEWEWQTKSF